jgi:hypothetical protein
VTHLLLSITVGAIALAATATVALVIPAIVSPVNAGAHPDRHQDE